MLLYALLVCSTFLPAESAPSLVCDGVHDDTAALQAQLDSGHLEVRSILPPLRFFKLEDTAGIIIALVSVPMTPNSILLGDSFYMLTCAFLMKIPR